jgi:arsenical pump membrane protein
VIVQAASGDGLDNAVRAVLPTGGSLPDLLAIAALSAVFANLVNNLPATLMLVPVAAAAGTGPVLATLVGVNIGPNLTYVGSLATLLWAPRPARRGHRCRVGRVSSPGRGHCARVARCGDRAPVVSSTGLNRYARARLDH